MAERRPRKTRAESREETKTRLLDAAEEVFAERGLYGASLEDVAERAGYTRGALYWHFKDKEQLFAAVIERRSEQRLADIASLASATVDGESLVVALRLYDQSAENTPPTWQRLALEQVLTALRDPMAADDLRSRERKINQAMGEVAHAALEASGLQSPLPPEQMGVVIHALDLGLRVQRALDPASAPPSLLYDVLSILLRGAQHSPLPKRGRATDGRTGRQQTVAEHK